MKCVLIFSDYFFLTILKEHIKQEFFFFNSWCIFGSLIKFVIFRPLLNIMFVVSFSVKSDRHNRQRRHLLLNLFPTTRNQTVYENCDVQKDYYGDITICYADKEKLVYKFRLTRLRAIIRGLKHYTNYRIKVGFYLYLFYIFFDQFMKVPLLNKFFRFLHVSLILRKALDIARKQLQM